MRRLETQIPGPESPVKLRTPLATVSEEAGEKDTPPGGGRSMHAGRYLAQKLSSTKLGSIKYLETQARFH